MKRPPDDDWIDYHLDLEARPERNPLIRALIWSAFFAALGLLWVLAAIWVLS